MQNGSTTYGTTAGAMMVLYNVVDYLLLVIKPQTKTRRLRQLLLSLHIHQINTIPIPSIFICRLLSPPHLFVFIYKGTIPPEGSRRLLHPFYNFFNEGMYHI